MNLRGEAQGLRGGSGGSGGKQRENRLLECLF